MIAFKVDVSVKRLCGHFIVPKLPSFCQKTKFQVKVNLFKMKIYDFFSFDFLSQKQKINYFDY